MTFNCDKCDFNTEYKSTLKRHKASVHNIDVRWFYCDQPNCDHKCKHNSDLKRHLQNLHDMGDKECEICFGNCFSLTRIESRDIDEKGFNIIVKKGVCRNCYRKMTGYKTRIEKKMVEYLREDKQIGPYIIDTDKIVRNDSCNTRRRPDLLIGSTDKLKIIVECDEHGHSGYNRMCELGRMDEIIDEFKEGRIVFIRWNPHYCKRNGKRLKVNIKERLKELSKLIVKLVKEEVKQIDNRLIEVYYMYYSDESELITNRHKKILI